jgi:DNA replication and repair protein RecF
LKNVAALSQWIHIIWPISNLNEGMTARRSYLNRLVFVLFPCYALLVMHYEKALKQRNLLLAQGETNSLWYDSLDQVLAEKAVLIAQYRNRALAHLMTEMELAVTELPVPHLSLEGESETLLNHEDSSSAYAQRLSLLRSRDVMKKTTSFGIHKTRFLMTHPNTREASLCSTGEQKGLLLSMTLALLRLSQTHSPEVPHVLLLDEVMAHVDERRQEWVWQEMRALKAQVFLTGLESLKSPPDVVSVLL